MNIEKVSNGYVVEVPIELCGINENLYDGIEKVICPDILNLLNFINSHYGNEEARSVVIKDE